MKDNIKFSALNPYIKINVIKPEESVVRGSGFIEFGLNNKYPEYLYGLYNECSTLHSIIEGCKSYILGDGIEVKEGYDEKSIKALVEDLAQDLLIYGGSYISVIRNRFGGVSSANTLDFRCMRSNIDNSSFYYSPDFLSRKSYGRCRCTVYPSFSGDPVSIYYVKNTKHQVYPSPVWSAATISAELEKNINQYHLNSLENGFAPNVLVSFCNGVPEDSIKEEIERLFSEKYTGYQNSGRVAINWCEDKEHSIDIQTIDTQDFGERYQSLVERARSELFISFRATPNLFGLPDQTTGFNSQEYSGAFKLFQKTLIQGFQNKIENIVDDIYQDSEVIKITPFTINFD